jgi:methyl-accepting chemotaxis protein
LLQYAPVVSDATRSIETVLEEISFATGDSVKAIDAVSVSGQKMAHLVKETSAVVSKSAHSAYEAKAAMEQLHRTVKEHNGSVKMSEICMVQLKSLKMI